MVGDAELTTIEQYQDIFNVNTFGTIRVTKTFLPLLRKAHGMSITLISVFSYFLMSCVCDVIIHVSVMCLSCVYHVSVT